MSEPQEKLLFASQLLIEKTLHYSLDSNKARTLNVPSLIEEALTQIDAVENEAIPDINFRIIIDEINKNLFKNKIVTNLMDFPLELLKVDSDQPIEQIRPKLEIAASILSDRAYVNVIFYELENNFGELGKKDISFYIGELVTTLVNMGMSASHIHFCTKNVFSKRNQMTSSSFKKLLKTIHPLIHQFQVCLKVSPANEAAKGIDLSIFGIDFFENIPEEFAKGRPSEQFKNLSPGEKYIVLDDIENYDLHAALVQARARISNYVNLFKMFDHKVEFDISSEALIDQCCIEGINSVKHSVNRMHYVSWQKRENISDRIASIIKYTKLRGNTDFGKFIRVIDMHGMALSTPIVESQLISLWTCYETLTPTSPSKSTIESICRRFVPIIGVNYVSRLIHDAYDHCANIAPHKFWKDLEITGNDAEEEIEYFCSIILNKENHNKLGKALAHLDNLPLLRFKIYTISERFGDPKSAVSSIDDHCERVRWQIRRLYRSRNQIVHSGGIPKFAETLLENGHDYFDQIFLTICELASGNQGLKTFEQCFNFSELSFNNYMSKLKKREKMDDEAAKEMIWSHYYP